MPRPVARPVPQVQDADTLPSPADLAGLPAASPRPAPWEGALPAPSGAPDEVRTTLLEALWSEMDRVKAEGDRAFLVRLSRECGSRRIDFPLFPDAALRLDTLLRKSDPSAHHVARIIRREPDLVRRVWQEANGSQFSGKVATLDEAIVRIGFDSLWRIAMRACMDSQVFRVRGYQAEVNQVRAVSIVTADLASTLQRCGDAFLAGLLHSIGKLMVYRAASVRPGQAAPDPALVHRVARHHHPSIGVLIASAWKMSREVCGAIAFQPDAERLGLPDFALARSVRAACIAAHTVAQARSGRDVGGLHALLHLPGPSFDAAWLLSLAEAMWDGLIRSEEGADGSMGHSQRDIDAGCPDPGR